MDRPTPGRIVLYRSRTGYVTPAIVATTVDTLARKGVELYEETARPGAFDRFASGIPPLDGDLSVHLIVFSAGLPGNNVPASDMDANVGGTYREWNVGGDDGLSPGTWCWPQLYTPEELRGVRDGQARLDG